MKLVAGRCSLRSARGNLDWPLILEAAEKAGVRYYVVEQDVCPGDSLDSMKISADYLKTQLK